MTPVLILPGIYDSGPDHWQSRWETQHAGVTRVVQRDWDHPVCAEWVRTLEAAVAVLPEPPILVAHSLGCLLAAHWAAQSAHAVRAMLLVAVPDPAGANFPPDAAGFAPLPDSLGARQATVISSSDDPYSTAAFVTARVRAWKARHIEIGARGHINAESGLGEWPQGWAIVEGWREAGR